ncbi:MAG: oligoribonuclease [Gammaproteobacteria bacterium RIFCSPHIGHO2_12_FULL_37_34]|nr:MAG: oligoribonuclease [Gammaproteobacteria bacterium RIFCSPHIGHO2_12_FULL_37_34]
MSTNGNHLIWIDLEMTGLQPEKDRIIEIATIVTDSHLNELAEGPSFVIHQPNHLLTQMDDWNVEHHTNSGLLERVKASECNEQHAEAETLKFLREYVLEGKSPMCGNSIWQDRRFLYRYMPLLEKYFHYRMIDVSTLKELALRWAPDVYQGVQKESRHRALDDIRDSIEELRYYRRELLHL